MKSTHTFLKLYNQLNHEQKKAVDTTEGPIIVIAGPGTGKTQILTLRIAKILLETQAEPENILALTYTEAGAKTMRQRLVSIIGPTAYRVGIYTFHGLATYLISTHPEYFSETVDFEPINELEQIEILLQIFDELPLSTIKPIAAPAHYVKDALRAITHLKKENILPDDFLRIIDKHRQATQEIPDLYHEKGAHKGKMKGVYTKEFISIEKNTQLQLVYERYEQILKNRHFYDYDDLLIQVITQLKAKSDFLLETQEQFQYILVDEHQDTNASQNSLISLIGNYHPNPNIFVVGDEKQAIFRFQGASLENFLSMKLLLPETEIISLKQNYRSNQKILDNSHTLISYNKIPESVALPARIKLVSANNTFDDSPINICPVDQSIQEGWFVAWKIKSLLSQGIKPEAIAVLARKNVQLQMLQGPLRWHDIPFSIESKHKIMDDSTIQLFLLLLRSVCELENDTLISKVMFIEHFKIHPRDIIKISRFAKKQKKAIWDVLDGLRELKLELKSLEHVEKLYNLLCSWSSLAQNQPLDLVFTTILKQSGFIETIGKTSKFNDSLDNFIHLNQEIKTRLTKNKNLTLGNFLTVLDVMQDQGLPLETSSSKPINSGVHLITAHGAKGREFDYVIILSVNDGSWGNSRGTKQLFNLPDEYMGISSPLLAHEDKNAEERRLFYVAVTRARKQVLFVYPQSNDEGKPLEPSQFLNELSQSPNELESSSEKAIFDNWWKKNITVLLDSKNSPGFSSNTNIDALTEYVRETFYSQSLSVSALNNYLVCPWRFFFRNLVLLPEAKNASLVFGTAIHHALHVFFTTLSSEKNDTAIKDFESSIGKTSLAHSDQIRLLAEGEAYLPKYLKYLGQKIKPPFKSELSISEVPFSTKLSLSGKLDLVQFKKQSNQVIVWDFKTGKPKSRNEIEGKTKLGNGDYKRQLVFYHLLLQGYQGGRFAMNEGVISFIKPKTPTNFISEIFFISKEDVSELRETICCVEKEISNFTFAQQKCNDEDCEYCALRFAMSS